MATAQASTDPIRAFLVEESRSGVVILDTTGRIVETNAAFARLRGEPADDLIGVALSALLLDIRSTTPPPGRHLLRDTHGTIHPLDLRTHLLPDGGWVVSVHDLTAEEEQEERFRLAFDDAGIGMALIGDDERYVRVNHALARVLGRSIGELIGASFRDFTHPDDLALTTALAHKLRHGTVPAISFDKRYLRRDGSVVWVHVNTSLVRGAGGEIRYALAQVRDITSRRQLEESRILAEAALQENDFRFRETMQAAGIAIWELDQATLRLTVSEMHRDLFDLAPDTPLPTTVAELRATVHPDDREAMVLRRSALSETPGTDPVPFEAEYRIVTHTGEIRWMRTRGKLMRRSPDDPGTIRAITRDVTDELAMRFALIESEERFRSAFEASAIGMAILSSSGETLRVNAALARMAGRDAAALTAMRWTELVHPDDHAEVGGRLRQIVTGNLADARAERRLVHRDGSVVDVRMTSSAVHDAAGVVAAVFVQIEDITASKALERARRRSEERFGLVIEALEDGIWDHDLRAGVGYTSPRYFTMLGYPARSQATYADFLALVHPDDLETVLLANERQIMDPTAEPYDLELRLRRADGSWARVRARGRVVERDAEGHAARMIGAHSDVTAQRELEEQFRQAQKMEAIGKLAGGIAHDFNNLLAAVSATTEIILQDLPLDHDSRGDVEQIRSAAERATTLTRQLLAFSRQEVEQLAVVDVDGAIARVGPLLQRMLIAGQELVISPGAPGSRVLLDAAQLELALLNLVANARDAMPDGGTITIHTSVDTHGPRTMVRIAVRDTGAGMDETVRARVFEPFFTTKPQGAGTGLGLPTVYGFVQRVGGNIELESAPESGSCFTLILPISAEPPEARSAGPEPETAAPGGACGVLIVDDEDAVRSVARRLLERSGYRVWEANNANAGLLTLESHAAEIAVVLSDHAMPGGTGRDLLTTVSARYPGIRTVLMSGFAGEGELRDAVEGREITFIQKPFTLDELLRSIAG